MFYLDEIEAANIQQLRNMYLAVSAEIRDLQEELKQIDKLLHDKAEEIENS